MEFSSNNPHPGDDVLENGQAFILKVNPTPYDTTYPIKPGIFTFYLFLCPLFHYNLDPLTPPSGNEAPFHIHTKLTTYRSAYLIYKGKMHFGFKIQVNSRAILELKIKLKLRKLIPPKRFELAQFFLFSIKGNFKPMDVRTVVIYHDPRVYLSFPTADIRPSLPYPLPYYQSPYTYPPYYRISSQNTVNVPLLGIGDTEYLMIGYPTAQCHKVKQIIGDLLNFPIQISFPARKYLLQGYKSDKSPWLDEPVINTIFTHKPITALDTKTQTIFPTFKIIQSQMAQKSKETQTDEQTDPDLTAIINDLITSYESQQGVTDPETTSQVTNIYNVL